MRSISTLLQKMQELYDQPHEKTAIDIDLMLDYSRQLYATLLDARGAATTQTQDTPPVIATVAEAPADPPSPPVAPETASPDPIADHEPELIITPSSPPQPIAPAAAIPEKDIKKLIGINDKYQIISELFHNDKSAYETALQAINDSSSFTEATDWLHTHVSWNYNWNEDNYTVQLFYGLISHHFTEKVR